MKKTATFLLCLIIVISGCYDIDISYTSVKDLVYDSCDAGVDGGTLYKNERQ